MMKKEMYENGDGGTNLISDQSSKYNLRSVGDFFIFRLPIVRYFFVGGVAALTDIIFFYIFADILGFNYLCITVVGFIVATLVNYLLSIVFVFKSGVRFHRNYEVLMVYIISLVGLSVHVLVLYVSVEIFSLMLMISKFIAVGSAFIFNYSLRKYYIFKKKT